MSKVLPTKANLIKTKGMLSFSKRGYDLLDKKRTVLIREMMTLIEEAKIIEKAISEHFVSAYRALEYVNITMGKSAVSEIAYSVSGEKPFEVLMRSVMGVEIPVVKYTKEPLKTTYGFFRSNPSLDIAVASFTEVKYLMYALAEVESSIYQLAVEIKKTQKRANALDKIQIPRLGQLVKSITETLEEKEREDFFRLKRVKEKTKTRSI